MEETEVKPVDKGCVFPLHDIFAPTKGKWYITFTKNSEQN